MSVQEQREAQEQFYCSDCGEIQPLGTGFIQCRRCGHLGLRGFDRRPVRVGCTHDGCPWTGWDDGGVNNDLGRHLWRDHGATPA